MTNQMACRHVLRATNIIHSADLFPCRSDRNEMKFLAELRNIENIKFDLGTLSELLRYAPTYNLEPLDRYIYISIMYRQRRRIRHPIKWNERKRRKKKKNNFPFHCASHAKMCRRHTMSLRLDTTTETTIAIIPHHIFYIASSLSLSRSRMLWSHRVLRTIVPCTDYK